MEIYIGERMSGKRIKLNRFVAGPSLKQMHATILSGDSMSSTPTVEVNTAVYVMGQNGNLLTESITADSSIYNVSYFERNYSVMHPNLVDYGIDLEVKPTDSYIMDMIQFGNYAFNLTNETSLGNKYDLLTNPTFGNQWFYRESREDSFINDAYYQEPHELAIYPSTGDLSGQLANGSDELSGVKSVINDISFNLSQETPDIVYGYVSEGQIFLYVKDQNTNSNTVYSLSGGLKNSLPFAYLMEQPLMHGINFGRDGIVYGYISGDITEEILDSNKFVYTPLISGDIEQTLYSPYANDEDEFEIYYNPFKLKNMYNYNWNCEYDRSREMLIGARDYLKVGKSQESLWLSYRYYRELPTHIQNFELIERVGGLYKYRPFEGHKSNIYSIRINNSGLNDDLSNNEEQLKIQHNLREIVEDTVRNVVKKIAPSSTQLWQIQWIGN